MSANPASMRHIAIAENPNCGMTTIFNTLDGLLTPEVKVFAFTHISNSLGRINPAAELCRRARAVGALLLSALARLEAIPGVRTFGPRDRCGGLVGYAAE